MSEPRRDPFLATLGEDVEDLSRVAPAQAWASAGPTLSRAGFELLRRSAAGDLRVRRLGAGEVAQLDRLVAAGLLDTNGRLTDPGLRVAGTLAQPQGMVHVDAAVGRIPFSFQASLHGDHAVVVATASPQPWSGSDPDAEQVLALADALTIDDVPVGYLPVAVARWVGLGPAWSLATEPELLPEALVAARLEDPEVPAPAEADPLLREVWRQPWYLWTLRTTASQHGLVVVHAGDRGCYAMASAPEPGVVAFRAISSYDVWLRLHELVGEAGAAD
jgi:hypothetical protein